jgi:drug/metabolite transporter (DMT)-like permease
VSARGDFAAGASAGVGARGRGPLSPRGRARLLLLGSALAFGLMAVLARWLSVGAGGFTAGQLTVVRFVLGAALSLVAFRVRPGLYAPRNRRLLWTRGLSGGVVVVLYFLALARIPASEAGMLYALFPVFGTVFAVVLFGERPTVPLVLGIALATAGVALVLGDGRLAVGVGAGQLLALGAAFFAAVSAVVIRRMRATENAATIFFYFCLGGLPVALPFALDRWPADPWLWAVAALMAVAAWAAQVWMSEAYGALTVPEAAAWLQLTPLAQAALAAMVLGERPGAIGLVGMGVAVAGVALGSGVGVRARGPGPIAVPPPGP